MSSGSGLLSSSKGIHAHLVDKPGGVAGEVYDLRNDLKAALAPIAAVTVEEFTNPVSNDSSAAGLLIATATVAAQVVLARTDLIAAGLAQLALWPRQLVFTTAGTTPADAPATATVVGKDYAGVAATEVVTLAQTGTTANSTTRWSDITSITYPAADGTDATVAIGYDSALISHARATQTTPLVLTAANALVQTDLIKHPRQIVFTTAGTTPSDAPATVLITGHDAQGKPQTETVTLAQTGTTATSTKFFASITSLAFAAGDGTGATISVGFVDTTIGLSRPVKTRAGNTSLIKEIYDANVVTNGALTAAASALPYGSYTPNGAPNGVHDYAIYYEYDAA